VTPVGSHAVILSTTFSSGQVELDPTAPIEDARGRFQVATLGYSQSFDLLGRSASLTMVVPYANGTFSGSVSSVGVEAYRSGLADARVRLAVNLHGGPAMSVPEYLKWKEKRLISVSVTLSIPTGQYDPARLVNIGTYRWGIKPEMGFSHRWGHWVADWYLGAWFFTGNTAYFPGASLRTQQPALSLEGHWGYYFKPRLWVSADANFWAGSRSDVNGIPKQDEQRDSRIGATVSVPVNRHQAFKVSYSQGAYVTVGGAYRTLACGWQYSWIDRPR